MNKQQAENTSVRNVVIQHVSDFANTRITDTKIPLKHLAMDSLDRIELLLVLEKHYKIEFPDDAIERMTTVDDIVCFIEKAVKDKKTIQAPVLAFNKPLYVMRDAGVYCGLTEAKCSKLNRSAMCSPHLNLCERVQCVLYKNVQKMR